ncbi:hypothetical protein [Ponticoccus litoralis]|uniref:Uncharacterized protein n=1 Tax=Ponticoccus litoralis TaxID=422297 RepID=A0AAW9SA98_9RHOB
MCHVRLGLREVEEPDEVSALSGVAEDFHASRLGRHVAVKDSREGWRGLRFEAETSPFRRAAFHRHGAVIQSCGELRRPDLKDYVQGRAACGCPIQHGAQ